MKYFFSSPNLSFCRDGIPFVFWPLSSSFLIPQRKGFIELMHFGISTESVLLPLGSELPSETRYPTPLLPRSSLLNCSAWWVSAGPSDQMRWVHVLFGLLLLIKETHQPLFESCLTFFRKKLGKIILFLNSFHFPDSLHYVLIKQRRHRTSRGQLMQR